jgi:putative inorganic carbon (hco3(-)) transporter
LSDFLAGAGVLIAAGASAAAILLPPGRMRSLTMLVAIGLFPVLILGDQWHTTQIVDLRHDDIRIAGLLAIAIVAVSGLAYLFRRWPILLPLAIVFALPFRVPLHAGGDTANLLVPLYLVIAGGVVAVLLRDWTAPPAGGGRDAAPTGPAGRAGRWLPRALAAVVVLYALQTLYSEDFSKGLQNVCFFLVPFTVAYGLLSGVSWDRRLVTLVLWVVGIEATVFVLIGTVEYVTRDLFWNDQVIRSNEFHTYFRVNSVFWDPNVYGRYLALVVVVATAALLWVKERREFALLTVLIGILWLGLAQTFSQSSYVALLAGLAVLAAIRWSWRWTLAAAVVGAIGAALVVVLVGGSGKLTADRLNIDVSGRGNLISGGVDLFGERPIWGYGSGSFQEAYRDRRKNKDLPVTVSHTEPVTVAAEQGLIGLFAYVALIAVALWTMTTGIRAGPAARAAVLAAFVALLVHTMAYAGFFEDPITWVLLAVTASLAATPAVRDSARGEAAAVRDSA